MSNKRISQFTETFSGSTESFLAIVVDGVNFKIKKGNFIDSPQIPVKSDWLSTSGISEILNKPVIYIPPFNTVNNSHFPRLRDNNQFGPIGSYSYDFSDANIGAYDDPFGQVGQIGVHPSELYGALSTSTYTFGYNVSAQGYGDVVFGMYNHSDTTSQFSTLFGRNNYNSSYGTLISGSYNKTPFTYLGHKTVFGNGNIVNGSAGLTSGVALLNKSFSTTVLGQANLDYTNTEQGVNNETSPILIVGNGNVATPIGLWTATYRRNALELLKNGLMTLPSVTNALITSDTTGKAVITKEYLQANTAPVQNLQSVLSNGAYATFGPYVESYVQLINPNNTTLNSFGVGNINGEVSNFTQTTTNTQISNKVGASKAVYQAFQGRVNIIQEQSVESQAFSTTVIFGDLISTSILKFPSKPTGTYTLATLDDVSGGLSAKENVLNKQNSLVVDGTGRLYPTVDAINAGLLNTIHRTGDETIISGIKTFATGNVIVVNTGNYNTFGLKATTSSNGVGIEASSSGNGAAIQITASGTFSVGVNIDSTSSSYAQYISNSAGIGLGIVSSASSNALQLTHLNGHGIRIQANGSGNSIELKQTVGTTGFPILFKDLNNADMFSINKFGVIRINALNLAPVSATDTGAKGEVRITANYIYVCTETNTWVRTPLTTW